MATSNSQQTNISFGDFELDLQLGVLRKNGIRLRCQEQPLQVLAALTERPGELVTREELRRRVWSHDTYVDFDHALNTAIKKIRAALNDDADAPRYIETVPRRGYRFVAALELKTTIAPVATPPAAQTNHRLWTVVLGALVVVHIALFLWVLAAWRRGEASTLPDYQRLTFDQPGVGSARFTPDGMSVVYSSEESSHGGDIYLQSLSVSTARSLGMRNSSLLSVSPQGELAVLQKSTKGMFEIPFRKDPGTLARVSLGDNAPRELHSAVEGADWSPDGQLAVVRRLGHRSRLEFPVGKVLYESPGWIDSPRFSPAGDSIAFLDHPVVPDDRGSVSIVDLKGTRKVLSGVWESTRGLAWNPRTNEIWFAAARSGLNRNLYAVTLNGHERRVLSLAGGLSLRDIARDGRVLLTRDSERLGIVFMGPTAKEPRELSWKDWSIAVDITDDGKQILFGEEGENSGSSYQVGLRPTDGSPPVILGPGAAQSLSPDGKWALSLLPAPDDQILLLPTGAGTSKTLERGSVERYQFLSAKWFPDSRQIVFVAYESARGSRCYAQSIDAGAPRAFTPDGMIFCSVSPSGLVLALTEEGHMLLYPSISSGKPLKDFALESGENPVAWSPGGDFLYLAQMQERPITIVKLDVASGRRQPWKEIPVSPLPGNSDTKIHCLVLTPDGESYAYTYTNRASDLYLVQGLK